MPPGSHGWDDELEFNTQFSSQWDSLVHMQHQPSGLAYNGIKPTQEGLDSPQTTAENKQPTIDHWHSRGGLVGRGVLIDFKAYMESQSKPYHCLDGYRITVEDVEEVACHQGVEFLHGDILIIRTGVTEICKRHLHNFTSVSTLSIADHARWQKPSRKFLKSYFRQLQSNLTEIEKANMMFLGENPTPEDFAKMQKAKLSGLHGSVETAKWVWNKHFSAVAGDSQSFEAYPPLKPDGTEGSVGDLGKSQIKASLALVCLLTAQSFINTFSRSLDCPSGSCGTSRRSLRTAKRPVAILSC